jgi:hypothetical protein
MPPGSSARKSSGKTRVCSDEFIEDDESAPPSDEEYSDESVHCFYSGYTTYWQYSLFILSDDKDEEYTDDDDYRFVIVPIQHWAPILTFALT